jgi:hypothetical protein
MSPEDEQAIYEAMRAAMKRARGYADFFGWATNRDLEEQNVAAHVAASLDAEGKAAFSQVRIRGRGQDPPDLEALDANGRRVAVEVTELVDGSAIEEHKAGNRYHSAEWDEAKFLSRTAALLKAKNERLPNLKGGPYPGGYVVILFTDEPELPRTRVEAFLAKAVFEMPNVTKAFLLLSYDPQLGRYPCFELAKSEPKPADESPLACRPPTSL